MSDDLRPRRRPLRLPDYDYSQAGAYFITVCTQGRIMLLGDVIDDGIQLDETGMTVQQTWDELPMHYHDIILDAFIVMPNHVHGIIILADERDTRHAISEIVRGFKTFSARRAMNVAACVVPCGSAATTNMSFAMRKHWIAFAITSRIILRGGRMTRTMSPERPLPIEGGFETRPYTSPDCALPRTATRYLPGCLWPAHSR